MALTPGDGGGSTASLCPISPTDQVQIVDNLLDRIQALEKAVSELLAVNVMANQLSDISQQIGWVTGITYMGVEGWTQTEAGTLIPPAGFSLSGSGLFKMFDFCTGEMQDYQGVSVDSDGVIQFGFKPSGEVCGEKVQEWDGASQPDYYKYVHHSGVTLINEGRNVTAGANSLPGATTSGSLRVTVTNGGLWLVQVSGYYTQTGGSFAGSSVAAVSAHSDIDGGPVGNPTLYHRESHEIQAIRLSGFADYIDAQNTVNFNQSGIFEIDDSNLLTILMSVNGHPNLTGLTFSLTQADITFIRLGPANP